MITCKLLGKGAMAIIPMAATVVLIGSNNPMTIRMQAPFDPTTFNAAVGPGTCVGNGTITFDQFIREVTAAHKAGAWHFDPTAGTLAPGTILNLQNGSGETHTFTKVKEFGGGFVAPLNALSGHPVPAPECALATLGGLVPKPPSPSNVFV